MRLKTVRTGFAVVFVAGIATMIVTSIVSNNMGVMVTTGLVTAAAAVILLVVTSVTDGRPLGSIADDIAAERLERRIGALVAEGADEDDVRGLVRESMRLGRSTRADLRD